MGKLSPTKPLPPSPHKLKSPKNAAWPWNQLQEKSPKKQLFFPDDLPTKPTKLGSFSPKNETSKKSPKSPKLNSPPYSTVAKSKSPVAKIANNGALVIEESIKESIVYEFKSSPLENLSAICEYPREFYPT